MSRINENNCWASVQVVNKEPQTLLSPTTERCWHKKNSIFLCRNHLLNSLVLNRTHCLLLVHFIHALETSHSIKVELKKKKSYCNIRYFLTNIVLSFTCDISLRSCRKWQSLKIQCEGPPLPKSCVALELGSNARAGNYFHPWLDSGFPALCESVVRPKAPVHPWRVGMQHRRGEVGGFGPKFLPIA